MRGKGLKFTISIFQKFKEGDDERRNEEWMND